MERPWWFTSYTNKILYENIAPIAINIAVKETTDLGYLTEYPFL